MLVNKRKMRLGALSSIVCLCRRALITKPSGRGIFAS